MKKFLLLLLAPMLFSGCLGEAYYQRALRNYPKNLPFHIANNYSLLDIEKSPERFRGAFLTFNGRVVWAKEDDHGLVMQVLVDPGYQATATVFVLLKKPMGSSLRDVTYTSINRGDDVAIAAFCKGALGSGETVPAFEVVAVRQNWREAYFSREYESDYYRWANGQLYQETYPGNIERSGPIPKPSL